MLYCIGVSGIIKMIQTNYTTHISNMAQVEPLSVLILRHSPGMAFSTILFLQTDTSSQKLNKVVHKERQ